MGIFSDIFLEVLDNATCGMVSMVKAGQAMCEADTLIKQHDEFLKANSQFDDWLEKHKNSYIKIQDALDKNSYLVDPKILHPNISESDGIYEDEVKENNRRKKMLEDALVKSSLDYAKKIFKDYLIKTEHMILDSYSIFCVFQVEMSYLPDFQKKIIDSIYLPEIQKLLNNHDTTHTTIEDLEWQIKRHKIPAGHAIVLLTLLQKVYNNYKGLSEKLKNKIDEILIATEDIVINNTYKSYLPDNADNLDPDTLLRLGKDAFLCGEPEKAFASYLLSAQNGNIEAQYRTGVCFQNGLGVFSNANKAVYWYKKAAESCNSVRKYYLATTYHWLLPKDFHDYNKAYKLYQEAFEEGVAEAADNIGEMYTYGIGVEKNDNIAVEWYNKGASAGSAWSMYHLYRAYMNGQGIEEDVDKARQWFTLCTNSFNIESDKCEKLLDVGSESLVYEIAYVYYLGNSVISKDIDKAKLWAEKGALIGDTKSMDILGRIYPETNCKSIQLLTRAAEYGFSWSINSIGIRYYNGNSIPKNRVLASTWFLRGAKFGNSIAQENVACAFLRGDSGFPQDIEEARHWFTLSAEQGSKNSEDMLDELNMQDRENHKLEMEQLKKELVAKKSKLVVAIKEIDKKIDNAQNPREEEVLIKKKEELTSKISELDSEIAKIT